MILTEVLATLLANYPTQGATILTQTVGSENPFSAHSKASCNSLVPVTEKKKRFEYPTAFNSIRNDL